ncbi:MAG TPA: M48 family metalloprotease [Gemmatimonadales bacterium]|nr:M48 family metalloprotease [Gemmatimonadales bacterium]
MAEPSHAAPPPLLMQLAQPSKAYRRGVWLAVASLSLFLILYFLLAGWFLVTAYQLTLGADTPAFSGLLVGLCAAFLALFMVKAVFFVRRGGSAVRVEITRQEQPRLFTFLDELADRTQAPRPHKVFLSPHVNAAVFYNLSPLNLIIPSKKNIEIGLALVNVLTLGEFRAVVAHEYGHVTQRSMVVGQWAFMAEQVAASLVARRDALDSFLNGLSRFDIRIAWVGWLLSLIVWSIRSLVDTAFGLVLRLQRALAREMEFHADLVAVSVTGSDAIIHALLRLQAADDSWGRTRGFAFGRLAAKHVVRDVFTLHALMQRRMEDILHDLDFARVPAIPADRPAEHRVFKTALAQPPQMWVTHPPNQDRESNAKRRYIAAAIEPGSAWTLFDHTEQLREKLTAVLLESQGKEPEPMADSVAALQHQFAREFLDRRYRGVYLGRSVVRGAEHAAALTAAPPDDWRTTLDHLYPEHLVADVASWRTLRQEADQLEALQSGALKPPGGVIRYRGDNVAVSALPRLTERVKQEARDVEQRLLAGDQTRRSVHLAAAAELGHGWESYLRGILAVLHYADHTEANLDDLRGQLAHTVRVATVTGRVSQDGRDRVIAAAGELHRALGEVYGAFGGSRVVRLDSGVAERLNVASWDEHLGRYSLPPPDTKNIAEWLKNIDGWVDNATAAYAALRDAALDQLLLTEADLAGHVRAGTTPPAAPDPSRVPDRYDALVAGGERKRETHFTPWQRVMIAHGVVPALVRFALAAGIVVAVLGFGRSVDSSTVSVYNGLALPVDVRIGDNHVSVRARSAQSLSIASRGTLAVEARAHGSLVERFDVPTSGSFAHYVYNVAGATPLVEWTVLYGTAGADAAGRPPVPPRMLGNPRWTRTAAEYVFEDPPERVETSGNEAERSALSALSELTPARQLDLLPADSDRVHLAAAHLRWDLTASGNFLGWLSGGLKLPDAPAILAARLSEAPDDVILLRLRQDEASDAERDSVCERDRQRSAAAPDNGDLRYVALRCITNSATRLVAMREGRRHWPQSAWFAYGVGYGAVDSGLMREAIPPLEQAASAIPAFTEYIAVDLARIHRLLDDDPSGAVAALAKGSQQLSMVLSLETGQGLDSSEQAYRLLALGHIDSALALAKRDTAHVPRLVRLAAASDGASPRVIAQALALAPGAGVDVYSRWSAVGLAARVGQPFVQFFDSSSADRSVASARIFRFVDRVKRGGDLRDADTVLTGLSLVLRGEAYSAAVIALGPRAPEAWRRAAKGLLFAPERPYFR